VDALEETRLDRAAVEPAIPEQPTLWPLRSVNAGARYH